MTSRRVLRQRVRPDPGTTATYPTIGKGTVTATVPFTVDDLPATNVTGQWLAVGDTVWMLVDQGRRFVFGVATVRTYRARVYRSSNQGIASGGGGAVIAFNVEEQDDDDIHNGVGTVTSPVDGWAQVDAQWTCAGNSTGIRAYAIRKNGTGVAGDVRPGQAAVGSIHQRMLANASFPVAAGDTIDFAVFQNSGVTLNALSGSQGAGPNTSDGCHMAVVITT